MSEDLRKDIILSVKTDTQDAQQGIDDLKKGLEGLNETPTDKPFKSLKAELKEAKNAYYELANGIRIVEDELKDIDKQFGKTSSQYEETENRLKRLQSELIEAAKKSADLKDSFAEANATVEAFNPDNKMQALVGVAQGATQAVQGFAGAMAFLGVESGTASETIAKLQGLMAFSDAFNSIGDIKDSFKNFGQVLGQVNIGQKFMANANLATAGTMRVLGVSANTTSFAFKALRAAIISTGIGALIIGITTLLPIITNWISGTEDAEQAQKNLESAVRSLNEELDFNQKAISHATKLRIEEAKRAGKSQEELFAIEREGRLQSFKDLERDLKAKSQLEKDAFNKDTETYKKAQEEKIAAEKALSEKSKEIELSDAQEQTRLADEKRKKDKESADKAKNDADKAASERKAKADAERAKREADFKQEQDKLKQHFDAIKQITDDGQRNIALSKLNDKDKELAENTNAFNDQLKEINAIYDEDLAILKKQLGLKQLTLTDYNKKVTDLTVNNEKAISTITEQKGINELAITKKYNQLISDFIDGYQTSEYERQRNKLISDFDEKIAIADEKQKALLEKLKGEQVAKLDTEETLRKNVVTTETNVINTELNNVEDEDDSLEQITEKITAKYNAKVEAENALYELEKQRLAGQKEELEQLEAEHQRKLVDLNVDKNKQVQAADDAAFEKSKAQYTAIGDLAKGLGSLLGKQTVAAKALNIANATMNTYTGITEIWRAKSVLPEPFGTAQKVVSTAIAAGSGFAAVKNILSTKVPGGDGGAGAAAPPTFTAPSINSTVLQDTGGVKDVRVTNMQEQVVKAYISQRDLQTEEEKAAFVNKLKEY